MKNNKQTQPLSDFYESNINHSINKETKTLLDRNVAIRKCNNKCEYSPELGFCPKCDTDAYSY